MMHFKTLVTTAPIPNSDGWSAAVLEIHPHEAQSILEQQDPAKNRKLRNGTMLRYAATMRAAAWVTSPEPLMFSPDGRLLNGQHRLNALVKANQTQQFLCIFGVSESVFKVLDRGATRSVSDALGIPKRLTEVARFLEGLRNPTFMNNLVDANVAKVAEIISPSYEHVAAACNTNRSPFSVAGFRAAATLRIFSGGSVAYVTKAYRDLVLQDWDEAFPICRTLIKAHSGGNLLPRTQGQQLSTVSFARGWAAFNPENRDRTRMPPLDVKSAREAARAILVTAFEDANV